LANNFAIRHNNREQRGDYDRNPGSRLREAAEVRLVSWTRYQDRYHAAGRWLVADRSWCASNLDVSATERATNTKPAGSREAQVLGPEDLDGACGLRS